MKDELTAKLRQKRGTAPSGHHDSSLIFVSPAKVQAPFLTEYNPT